MGGGCIFFVPGFAGLLFKMPAVQKNGPVAKYAHEKNHIDHPERAWLMWFFALELNCYEKLWNASSVYSS